MRILVGVSGGADSAVAAKILLDQGFDVTACTLKLLPEFGNMDCCQEDMLEAAGAVAHKLGIKHIVYDFRREFTEKIIGYFTQSYKDGLTPNPCFICNSIIKFGLFLDRALKEGFDAIATGHYAQVLRNTTCGGRYALLKGKDSQKDQSYFLALLTQKQLSKVIFPLALLTKTEVKKISELEGLTRYGKPESQDICFIPHGDYAKVIEQTAGAGVFEEGNFLNSKNEVVGRHKGIQHYTIGQRRGLNLAFGYPVYVLKKDAKKNTVTVGTESELFFSSCTVAHPNFISVAEVPEPMEITVKIRYRQKEKPAFLVPLQDGNYEVIFKNPERAAALGQAAIFYSGNYVIGGGIITKTSFM